MWKEKQAIHRRGTQKSKRLTDKEMINLINNHRNAK